MKLSPLYHASMATFLAFHVNFGKVKMTVVGSFILAHIKPFLVECLRTFAVRVSVDDSQMQSAHALL